MVKSLINDALDRIIKDLFTRFVNFYELGNINETNIAARQNEQASIFQRIDLLCEEIANISNQNESFYKHLLGTFTEFKTEEKFEVKEVAYELQRSSLTNRVTELLGKFMFYEQLYLVNISKKVFKILYLSR